MRTTNIISMSHRLSTIGHYPDRGDGSGSVTQGFALIDSDGSALIDADGYKLYVAR